MNRDIKRETALADIAARARQHNITPDDIAAYMLAHEGNSPAAQTNILIRLLSYLGGLLVFTGMGYFISQQWEYFDSVSRVLITFGPGLIALILGVATLRDERYINAATPLFLIAAFMQPTGFFVLLHEYFTGDDAALACIIVFTPLMLQMLLLFSQLKRTSLLFFAFIYGTAVYGALMDKAGMDGDVIAAVIGFSGLLVSAALNRTPYRTFVPFTYFVYAACFAGGCFALLEDSRADILLIAIGGLMIFASVKAQSRSFLCASVLTMLCYLCYYTEQYFASSLGWPLALIFIGLFMIMISSYAVKKITASADK
ncbi:MAG: DUF2157 domain-containing protein [Alphaproteobacteria bacterium]|nr:DUF2157 domain-containing protein [Alphaproteobacteria bacterium]